MMPGAVGSGTFWTEATAWIVGGSTEDMLDNIEASWPAELIAHEVTSRGVGAAAPAPLTSLG